MEPVFKTVLLKLSGEVLAGAAKTGIDFDTVASVGRVIKKCVDAGVRVAIVVGGGNFWRGRSSGDMNRTRADQIGMLATVMNSIALAEGLEQLGLSAKVQTAIDMRPIAEPYGYDSSMSYLAEGKVVIFGGGTGSPYFSTDTAAALRAAQIGADVFLKATNVDGVYDKDPNKFSDAVKFDELTHDEVLERRIMVMDSTAAAMCRDNNIPILVFNLTDPENIFRAVSGEKIGTLVK